MIRLIVFLLFELVLLSPAYTQVKKKQILLVGTFHFHNPGLDAVKFNTFNVMSGKSQKELEVLSNKIKKFAPDKIFVEWLYNEQQDLQKWYNSNQDSLLKNDANEIVQLAMRTAKKLNHKRLYGIDYHTHFPYDSLMTTMKSAGQFDLIQKMEETIKKVEDKHNNMMVSSSLTDMLLYYNSKEINALDIGTYIAVLNRGGTATNFVGAYIVSEWYRRNLYMYSLIQKLTESKDSKIMVLLGASHVAMLREFIKYDTQFEIVELKSLL